MTPVVIDASAGVELVADTVRGRALRALLPSNAGALGPRDLLRRVRCRAPPLGPQRNPPTRTDRPAPPPSCSPGHCGSPRSGACSPTPGSCGRASGSSGASPSRDRVRAARGALAVPKPSDLHDGLAPLLDLYRSLGGKQREPTLRPGDGHSLPVGHHRPMRTSNEMSAALAATIASAVPPGSTIYALARSKPNRIVGVDTAGVVVETEASRAKDTRPQLVPGWMLQGWDELSRALAGCRRSTSSND